MRIQSKYIMQTVTGSIKLRLFSYPSVKTYTDGIKYLYIVLLLTQIVRSDGLT